MQLYEISFPLHEQRLPESQRLIMSHPEYHFDAIFDGGTFVGDMLYWRTDLLRMWNTSALSRTCAGAGMASARWRRCARSAAWSYWR